MATAARRLLGRAGTRAATVGIALSLGAAAGPGCAVGYVVRSGYYEAELLASRRPIDRVVEQGGLSAGQEQRLRLIPEIKAYGKTLGLSATRNYETLAVDWDRTIWNLSACQPLSFEPVTWWFPIVGRVPYLGYFVESDARTRETELRAQGYDVHVRTAGAFSTLGWFRDPVLPSMLRWSEADLAETVFHELAHATLWVPGNVDFNESFANFVGETAVERYLADRYGEDSEPLLALQRENRDWRRFEALLHGVYENLDTIYRDTGITVEEKAARKAAVYASMEDRVRAAGLEEPQAYINSIRRNPWNNARLMQFRTYNSNEDWFRAVLARNGGDLHAFVVDVGRITRGQRDPFHALEVAAAGAVKNP